MRTIPNAILRFLLLSTLGCVVCLRLLAQQAPPPPYRPMQLPGLDNVYAVAGRFLSGSAPESDEAFSALSRFGVKVILSVDGASPDVERAAKHGMRYVHLPFGYDGIPATNVVQLVKAAQTLPGLVYIHCHHGKHRGPAAVAVMCEGVAGWDASLAERWMRLAGTSTNYTGLYKAATHFQAPSAAQLASVSTEFPSRVKVSPLAEVMVRIDEHWTSLKAAQPGGFRDPKFTTTALQLQELLHEAHRTGVVSTRGDRFADALKSADQAALELTSKLDSLSKSRTPTAESAATESLRAVGKSCTSCHRNFRD
jgi:hypothetical protein